MTGYDKAATGNPDDDVRVALLAAARSAAAEKGGNLAVTIKEYSHLDEEVGQERQNEEEDVLSHDGLDNDAGARQRVLVLVGKLLELLDGQEERRSALPSSLQACEYSFPPPFRSATLFPQ